MSDPLGEFSEFSVSPRALRRFVIWGIVGAVLAGAAATLFVYSQPVTYRSWSQVLVRPLGVDLTRGPVNLNNAIDIEAERELAASFLVAERASNALDGEPEPRTIRRGADVEATDRSAVLEFSWADANREVARDVTQALAESYLDIRAEISADAVAESRGALDELRSEIFTERAELILFRGERALDDDERLIVLAEEAALTSQISQLSNDISILDSLTTDPGVIISPAQLADSSERPRAVPTIVAGALLGALLAGFATLILRRPSPSPDVESS